MFVSVVSVLLHRIAGQTETFAKVLNRNAKSHKPYVTEKPEVIWMRPAAAPEDTNLKYLPVYRP
jgi:hypothetical protein